MRDYDYRERVQPTRKDEVSSTEVMGPRRFVVVSDSFKGTLSSSQICRIARESIPRFFPHSEVITIPVADGGEGTVACFVEAINAQLVTVSVSGPYGEPIQAAYARSGDKAIIEMAAAAGLPIVGEKRNPSQTTTFGVGQMIRHAVESGCTQILLGLGGSATNDGGCGAAAALGTRFYDGQGLPFIPVGGTLSDIHRIDNAKTADLLQKVDVTVMCDVENPLYGPAGAAYIFAPQKGADEEMVKQLDNQLRALDEAILRDIGVSVANTPGAGAAGGMGGGCIAFLSAKLKSGIDAILDMVGFDSYMDHTDIVITGEGRIDSQSVRGKVISGIAKRTCARNIPLIAIVGSIAEDAQEAYSLGVTAMFGIDRLAVAFEEYAERSDVFYQRTLEDILRLLCVAWA